MLREKGLGFFWLKIQNGDLMHFKDWINDFWIPKEDWEIRDYIVVIGEGTDEQ